MGPIWNEIVPNDRFRVKAARPISAAETCYLTHLYQPLTGPVPVSLYTTLFNELPADSYVPQEGTHRWLMSLFMAPLDQIVQARGKLEALGLLRTVRYEADGGDRLFEYTLLPPLPPFKFFQDEILSIMLLNRVGKSRYHQLRGKFSMSPDRSHEPYTHRKKEITKTFEEVFCSVSPSELDIHPGSESDLFLQSVAEQLPLPELQEVETERPGLRQHRIDYEYLLAVMPKWVDPSPLSSPQVRAFLEEISFLYQLENEQLARLLQEPSVYDEDDLLDLISLKKLVKQWYREQYGGKAPVIAEQVQAPAPAPASRSAATNAPAAENLSLKNDTEKYKFHMKRLETTSPFILLQEYQGGGKVSAADQKIVEELLEQYLLPSPVANVLLEYVMYTHDKQLPKALIYKIAAHWKRAGIKTVQEAQQQAKQLYKKHMDNSKESGSAPRSRGQGKKQFKKKDKLPEWVEEQLKREKADTAKPDTAKPDTANSGAANPGAGASTQAEDDSSLSEKRERIAELLKKLRT